LVVGWDLGELLPFMILRRKTPVGVNIWLRQSIHYLKWIGFWHLMPSPEVGV